MDLDYLLAALDEDPRLAKHAALNRALVGLIDDYSHVRFQTLSIGVRHRSDGPSLFIPMLTVYCVHDSTSPLYSLCRVLTACRFPWLICHPMYFCVALLCAVERERWCTRQGHRQGQRIYVC